MEGGEFARAYSSSDDPLNIPPYLILPKSKDNKDTTEKKILLETRTVDSLLKLVESLKKKISICEGGNSLFRDMDLNLDKTESPKFSWVQPKMDLLKPDIGKNLALFGKPFISKK